MPAICAFLQMLFCRSLGGLEAWGLAVDSLREESAREVAEAELANEAPSAVATVSAVAVPCDAAATGDAATGSDGEAEERVTISRSAPPDASVMCQFEEVVHSAKELHAKVRDATLTAVRIAAAGLKPVPAVPPRLHFSTFSTGCGATQLCLSHLPLMFCLQMRLRILDAQRSHKRNIEPHFRNVRKRQRCHALCHVASHWGRCTAATARHLIL